MRKAVIGIVFLAAIAICGVAGAQECTLTNLTETLPAFFVNTPANTEIEACCGTEPYSFEIIGGALPEGLHMNSHGKITGKPRAETLDATVLVLISDSAGCSLGVTYPVQVLPEP